MIRSTSLVLALPLAASACGGGSTGPTSTAVPAVDQDPPAIAVTSPPEGVPLTADVLLAATVTDASGVESVRFLVDGAPVGPPLTAPPYETLFDTTTFTDGPHELAVEAVDVEGNGALSPPRPLDLLNHPLVLDTLEFSTFLGGTEKDSLRDVATDAHGNVYVTGGTESPAFPTTPGAFDETFNGVHDVFVAKFDPDGQLLWATLLGGPNYDRAYAIEVDGTGAAYVGGRAGDGFPTTAASLQPQFGGDVMPSNAYGQQDGFVAKLSPDGTRLEWATYLGVDDGSNLRDIAVDAAGAVFVASGAGFDFPSPYVPADALQPQVAGDRDAMIVKLAPDGGSVEWATYVGGTGRDGGAGSIRVDDEGTVTYLGHTNSTDLPVSPGAFQPAFAGTKDLFVVRLEPDGSAIRFLTYFGGSDAEFTETHGLWVDADGVVYVTATTRSDDLVFPPGSIPDPYQIAFGGAGGPGTGEGTNYPGDGFVAKLSADGTALLAFTYFGGKHGEGIEGTAVDRFGNVFISGATYSNDLPLSKQPLQGTANGPTDAFVACFSPNLSRLLYGTYVGGMDYDFGRAMAVTPKGAIIGAGVTFSPDLPTTQGAYDSMYDGVTDGLLFKID